MMLDAPTLDALGYVSAWSDVARWEPSALPFIIDAGPVRAEQRRAASEAYNRRQGRRPRRRFADDAERRAATAARVKANRSTPEARARDAKRKAAARAAKECM